MSRRQPIGRRGRVARDAKAIAGGRVSSYYTSLVTGLIGRGAGSRSPSGRKMVLDAGTERQYLRVRLAGRFRYQLAQGQLAVRRGPPARTAACGPRS